MKDTYFTSDEKIHLSIEIAQRERKLLSTIDYKEGYSLYVGIPFCPTTCLYCSFTSYPIGKWKDRTHEYLDALFKELDYVAEKKKGCTLDTVYFGGGTPTSLSPEDLDRLITKLKGTFVSLPFRSLPWKQDVRTASPGRSWRCLRNMAWAVFPSTHRL